MQVQRKIIDVHDTQVLLDLPPSFVNHRVEVIALTVDEEPVTAPMIRKPHPDLAGKGQMISNLDACCVQGHVLADPASA